MTIKLSTLEDANQAVKLLLDFHKSCDLPFTTNAAFALALFKACVNDEDKIAISKDGGILLGVVSQSFVGPFKQASEIAWYVDPAKRGGGLEMLRIYEKWAEEKGAKIIEVRSMYKFPEVENLYKKIGYEQIETSWAKVIK